jgi:intracellular multiplication protein IcmJ
MPMLIPGVERDVWRRENDLPRALEREISRVSQAIFERDQYTCQWCGFSTVGDSKAKPDSGEFKGFLEVHHLDNTPTNNDRSNLATICPFCESVFRLGDTGEQRKGKIVYMPWISQRDINLLVNCLAVAQVRSGPNTVEDAREMLVWLQAFEGPAIKKYGEAISDPELLHGALMGLFKKNPKAYNHRRRVLRDLRVIPFPEKYNQAVAWWSKCGWAPNKNWETTWDTILKRWKASQKASQNNQKR